MRIVLEPLSALRHAQDVISLERSLHIFGEGPVQHAALAVPSLVGTLGVLYLALVAASGLRRPS
jgi:hypothetical protein